MVKTYSVLMVKDGVQWLTRVSNDTHSSEPMTLEKHSHPSAEGAALESVRTFIGNQQALAHGTRVVVSSHQLAAYIVEVDMEFPDPKTGVPTSPYQTWLDRHGVMEDREEWANEVAIKLLTSLGYRPDAQSALGEAIEDEPQTLLIQTILHLPALEFVADIMESMNSNENYSLSDCINWESNTLGDCGGRVEMVNGKVVCEVCRNRTQVVI